MSSKWSTDRIVSISAIVVSLSTLLVIIYQTHLMGKAQRAAVMPYLEVRLSLRGDRQVIMVNNTGIGPAMIKEVRIITPDSTFVGEPFAFAKKLVDVSIDFDWYSTDLVLPGRLIIASQSISAFSHSVVGNRGNFISDTFRFPYDPQGWAVIEVTYASIYGDQWVSRSDQLTPESR
ncbi:MAG: hypothetical protein R8G66_09760 [Cytophagales bacterium]|nr:hypothetical protein [Cytophagales bacterium]